MGYLSDWRSTVRDALKAAGFNAHTTAPARPAPPLAFVGPSDPYLSREEGRSFGEEVLRLDVVLVAGKGVNDVKADELDDMIESALDTLDAIPGLDVARVDQPGQINLAGQSYLAVSIPVAATVLRSE